MSLTFPHADLDVNLTDLQLSIIENCGDDPGLHCVPHPFLPGSKAFAKRGNPSLQHAARNQEYVYQHALSQTRSLCVPEVLNIFSRRGIVYLIMEHIPAPSFRAWIDEPGLSEKEREDRNSTAVAKIADAVALLLQCPIPEGDAIGPIGGGRIHHDFFMMEEAPISFVNTAALEKYLETALSRRPIGPVLRDRVNLQDERRVLCPSDISLDNFLYDPETERVWMTEFEFVNVLPESFFSYYLHSEGLFLKAVAKELDLPVSPHQKLLGMANCIVVQSGNSSLGLNKYGEPKRRRPSAKKPNHIEGLVSP